jgi:hypothetical protein
MQDSQLETQRGHPLYSRCACIVQKRGSGARRTDNIYLPFEGDNILSLILSKAFLLADDEKIKDQTIMNQIRLDRILNAGDP